jgi:hypothetical protein
MVIIYLFFLEAKNLFLKRKGKINHISNNSLKALKFKVIRGKGGKVEK